MRLLNSRQEDIRRLVISGSLSGAASYFRFLVPEQRLSRVIEIKELLPPVLVHWVLRDRRGAKRRYGDTIQHLGRARLALRLALKLNGEIGTCGEKEPKGE